MKRRSFLGAIGALLAAPWRSLAGVRKDPEPPNPEQVLCVDGFDAYLTVMLASGEIVAYFPGIDTTYLPDRTTKNGRHLPKYAEWMIRNCKPMAVRTAFGIEHIRYIPPIHFSSDALADSVFNEVNP